MSWLTNIVRPGLKKREKKPEEKRPQKDAAAEEQHWIKCPTTGELVYQADLEAQSWVTPAGFHMRIGPEPRFKHLFDDGKWDLIAMPEAPRDPLRFRDDKRYVDRLKAARAKSGRQDCVSAAAGSIDGAPAVVFVQDFDFMGGSLGMAAGEGFIAAARAAIQRKSAFIAFVASGGARMQEGVLSLMQMTRTTLAVEEVREAGLPYICVLTDPTTGGVTASYAMLGDIHIAEPGALIGFTGPRVIEQTIRQKLPEGFQRAEYLREKGMVDMVVDRRQLKSVLGQLILILMSKQLSRAVAAETTEAVRAPRARARAAE